tara:strand:+ start:959 stop:1606 length:648 start_codon:yes stop_codon:yes gene_type:complete
MNDFEARKKIIFALWKNTNLLTFLFLTLRTFLLPLDKLNEDLDDKGKIVEIGSGHGIIIAYLALRSRNRSIIGYDPDEKRTDIAIKSFHSIQNVNFHKNYFDGENQCDCIIIYGTLCLMSDKLIYELFSKIKKSLNFEGSIYISDILKQDRLVYSFHIFRERLFKKINFTQGETVIGRELNDWKNIFETSEFKSYEIIKSKIFLHSTIDFLIKVK